MVHGSDQEGSTDKNSHEATEARHDGIESDLAGTAAVGGPDSPCSTRASLPAPWQAGAGSGTPKRDAWRRECHAPRARGDRRSRPVFERPCAPAVEHTMPGRSWPATRWAGTVSEITQAHEGAILKGGWERCCSTASSS